MSCKGGMLLSERKLDVKLQNWSHSRCQIQTMGMKQRKDESRKPMAEQQKGLFCYSICLILCSTLPIKLESCGHCPGGAIANPRDRHRKGRSLDKQTPRWVYLGGMGSSWMKSQVGERHGTFSFAQGWSSRNEFSTYCQLLIIKRWDCKRGRKEGN